MKAQTVFSDGDELDKHVGHDVGVMRYNDGEFKGPYVWCYDCQKVLYGFADQAVYGLTMKELIEELKERGIDVGDNGGKVKYLLQVWDRKKQVAKFYKKRKNVLGSTITFRLYTRGTVDALADALPMK